jgi:hypothetical protein
MPTVLRTRGFSFFFFSHEGIEPVHIHVKKGDGMAKFWLNPIKLAYNDGFKRLGTARHHFDIGSTRSTTNSSLE